MRQVQQNLSEPQCVHESMPQEVMLILQIAFCHPRLQSVCIHDRCSTKPLHQRSYFVLRLQNLFNPMYPVLLHKEMTCLISAPDLTFADVDMGKVKELA